MEKTLSYNQINMVIAFITSMILSSVKCMGLPSCFSSFYLQRETIFWPSCLLPKVLKSFHKRGPVVQN